MEDVEAIGAVELGLWFVDRDEAAERQSAVNGAGAFVFDADVELGVIGEAIGEERVGATSPPRRPGRRRCAARWRGRR